MDSPLPSVISGTFFGAALTAAGMYTPSTITQQMNLTNFHMLKAFLAASGSSALAILINDSIAETRCPPRYPSTISLPFGPYAGNIIGGVILGIGLTLSGACPGTVWSQLATGIPSARYVLAGAVLGGIIYSFLKPTIAPPVSTKTKTALAYRRPTLPSRMGFDKTTAVIVYGAVCAAGVYAADHYFPQNSRSLLPPWQGGLAVGASQFTSIFFTHSTLGSSAAFEQIGELFWWLFNTSKRPPSTKSISFAAGTFAGSYALYTYGGKYGYAVPLTKGPVAIEDWKAVAGGVCLVLGSRIAGGCTSGHGISGMSMLSIASFVTVAAMFGGGIGSAAFLRYRECKGVMFWGKCMKVWGM